MDGYFLNRIKSFEGFTAKAKWDYAQHSNGYGTRAAYPGEVVQKAEADRRFQEEINKAAAQVERFAPDLDAGSRAALTSLTFNAGTKWMQSGLGAAIKSGDLGEAKHIFLKYTKAGGADLPGLVNRRLEEVTWFQAGGAEPSAVRERQELAAPTANPALSTEGLSKFAYNRAAPAERPQANRGEISEPSSISVAFGLFEQVKLDRMRMLALGEPSEQVAIAQNDSVNRT